MVPGQTTPAFLLCVSLRVDAGLATRPFLAEPGSGAQGTRPSPPPPPASPGAAPCTPHVPRPPFSKHLLRRLSHRASPRAATWRPDGHGSEGMACHLPVLAREQRLAERGTSRGKLSLPLTLVLGSPLPSPSLGLV